VTFVPLLAKRAWFHPPVPVLIGRDRTNVNSLQVAAELPMSREGSLAAKEASRGKVDHANTSEIEKGRAAFRKGAHRTVEEKIEIGRQWRGQDAR
jgi:hypothetical protein